MYDAIVVGARCAGSPTAMLLARRGHRVLLVDRAEFPSDTLSTHYIHQPGVAALERWGLRSVVAASGCPPIRDYTLDVGPFALRGAPPPAGDVDEAYSVRRTVLDEILVRAAADAGAEVRERFAVDELVFDGDRVTGVRGRAAGGGAAVTERARIVIGADGRNSLVARAVQAPYTEHHPSFNCAYYSYWSGIEMDGVELYLRPGHMVGTATTNDGLVLVIAFWRRSEFDAVREDVEGSFARVLELAPPVAERVRHATRVDRFRGSAQLPCFFRRAHGDGWVLVGDAACHKDPILALGITDAFRDAELVSDAVDAALQGDVSALAAYDRRHAELTLPGFTSTLEFAQLRPPDQQMQQLFAALARDQEQTDRFFGTFAGTVSGEEFFAPDNLAAIIGAEPTFVA
jgi:flavin-dependent dehydrogenase